MSLLAAPITSPLHAVELGLAKHPAFAGHHQAHVTGAGAPAGQHAYEADNGSTATRGTAVNTQGTAVHTLPPSY